MGNTMWRNHGYYNWDKKTVSRIRGEILNLIDENDNEELTIIICGGTGWGKSSLINNLHAAISGDYSVVAQYGSTHKQLTRWYNEYPVVQLENGKRRPLSLRFADTRGFSESKKHGASVAAIQKCIMGHVADDEKICPENTEEDWNIEMSENKRKASYILFVADANLVPNDGEIRGSHRVTYKNMKEIRNFAVNEKIGLAAFITNCDRLDSSIRKDLRNLYYLPCIEKKVKDFSTLLDIPLCRTYPIVNYTKVGHVTDPMAMQALIPLKDFLHDMLRAL